MISFKSDNDRNLLNNYKLYGNVKSWY